ncbi:MAG: hypothetical protein GY757_27955, partial [bacterium]|nr:hypothetical protein [bacterium]
MDGLSYGTWQFKSSVTRPYMKMQSQSSESFMYSTIYKMATGPAYEITVKGAEHYNFTDMAFFPAFMKKLGIIGPIDGKRGVKIMNVYSLAFFDKHLNSIKTSLLNGPSKEYPEVAFESRNLQK